MTGTASTAAIALRASTLLVVATWLAVPVAASAQAYQCRVPQRMEVPRAVPDGPMRRLPVTGYTLALSWSPEFCKPRAQAADHRRQCGGEEGRFGLVVHGLWPESGGSWPQWCPTERSPTAAELAPNMCLSPSARLLTTQWAKHGSCMARRPATYFKLVRILTGGLRLPDFDRISREDPLTAGIVRTRFVDANSGWSREAVGVHLNRRGWLEDLRLCYGRDFKPARCDKRRYGAGDDAPVAIWRGL